MYLWTLCFNKISCVVKCFFSFWKNNTEIFSLVFCASFFSKQNKTKKCESKMELYKSTYILNTQKSVKVTSVIKGWAQKSLLRLSPTTALCSADCGVKTPHRLWKTVITEDFVLWAEVTVSVHQPVRTGSTTKDCFRDLTHLTRKLHSGGPACGSLSF